MKNKLFFFLLISLFFVSMASAKTIKQSVEYDIRHPVRINGGISTIDFCNITVADANNTVIVNFSSMTDQSFYFNYTLTNSHTALKGDLCYDITCAGQGLNDSISVCLLVNPTGITPSDERNNTMIFSIIFIAVIGILVIFTGFKTDNFPPLRWSLFIIGAIFILVALNVLFVSLQDEVVNPNIENLFDTIVAVSYLLYWFAGFLIFVIWFITIIANATSIKKQHKEEKLRGIDAF